MLINSRLVIHNLYCSPLIIVINNNITENNTSNFLPSRPNYPQIVLHSFQISTPNLNKPKASSTSILPIEEPPSLITTANDDRTSPFSSIVCEPLRANLRCTIFKFVHFERNNPPYSRPKKHRWLSQWLTNQPPSSSICVNQPPFHNFKLAQRPVQTETFLNFHSRYREIQPRTPRSHNPLKPLRLRQLLPPTTIFSKKKGKNERNKKKVKRRTKKNARPRCLVTSRRYSPPDPRRVHVYL